MALTSCGSLGLNQSRMVARCGLTEGDADLDQLAMSVPGYELLPVLTPKLSH